MGNRMCSFDLLCAEKHARIFQNSIILNQNFLHFSQPCFREIAFDEDARSFLKRFGCCEWKYIQLQYLATLSLPRYYNSR